MIKYNHLDKQKGLSMKMTPKSCGCKTCRIGKGSKGGKSVIKSAERAYRHGAKILLAKGREDVSIVPYGGYTD